MSRPDCVVDRLALGSALLVAGATGPVRTIAQAVVVGDVGDTDAARREIEVAAAIEPDSRSIAVAHARALADAGMFDAAIARIEQVPGAHAAHAEVIALRARRRGAHTQSEYRTLVAARRLALEQRDDPTVRHRLVRELALHGDYDAAFEAAAPTMPASARSSWRDLVDESRGWITDDWLWVAAVRLSEQGEHRAAQRTKQRIARRIADRPLPRAAPASRILDQVRAVSYLSGAEAATDHLDRHRPRLATDRESAAFDKARADLALARGNVLDLVRIRPTLAVVGGAAERRFQAAVTGARVLVSGPSDLGTFDDDELAGFDVIVSPKRPTSAVATATTIAYRSDVNARFDLEPDLAATHKSLADIEVVRASVLSSPGELLRHESVRVMPAEDSNTFMGTRFGIQRMLYDLVGRGAEITLGGVDFFTGAQPYVPGYEDELHRIYEPNSLQPIRSRAAHDLGWDFRFTASLLSSGLIEAHPDVRRLLEHSLDDYYDLLERVAAS